MDGYEVAAQHPRAARPATGPVLVALTGYGQEQDLRRSEDAGFDHHLVKPVNLEILRDLLDNLAAPGCRAAEPHRPGGMSPVPCGIHIVVIKNNI